VLAPYLESDVAAIADSVADIAEDFAGKTLVLGGGRGFLGCYFIAVFDYLNRERLSRPCTLIVLDNLITTHDDGHAPARSEHYQFLERDVSEPLDIDATPDFVVNAAGIASPYYYRAYPLETLGAAINGTRNLLEFAAARGARFTFFSSSEIYGDPDPAHVPTPESYRGNVACMGPRACYDESKRLGETLCYIFHGHRGVHTNTIRPFNVYGPGMPERDYRVLPNFASAIKGGIPLKVYGSGEQTRTYCYVTDAMNGFLRVIARGVPGEAYNVGNPRPEISVRDLVERISAVLGREVAAETVEYPDTYPADEPRRRCPDIRKARLQLGYAPAVELDEGLRRFLAWTERAYSTGAPPNGAGA
jgi:UDP-glucuronate decarboxylase